MKIKEVLSALERFAPLPLQEGYDNAGLQVGLTDVEASGALLCLDVTEAVVGEATRLGCNLIVSHHPVLFNSLKTLSDATYVQRVVMKAVREGITIFSMHTNLDNAADGVNFKISELVGLADPEFLKPIKVGNVTGGSGLIGTLADAQDAESFLYNIKSVFEVNSLMYNELLERPISRVAVCGGAGASLLDDAIAAGADAFITGEMGYHEFFGREQQIQIAVLGHYQSEQFTKNLLYSILHEACPSLPLHLTALNTNPINYL